MLIFLGWSGDESRQVALALKDWLRCVCNAFEPWISDDVTKGSRWSPEIAAKLNQSRAGILCLTAEALPAPWINFEAGAVSNARDALACTFLVRLTPANVKGPLAQFQHTLGSNKEDTRKLISDLQDKAVAADQGTTPLTEVQLNKIFDKWWPELEERLKAITPTGGAPPSPSMPDMLQEILLTVRELVGRTRTEDRRSHLESLVRKALAEDAGFWKMAGAPPSDLARVLAQKMYFRDTSPDQPPELKGDKDDER